MTDQMFTVTFTEYNGWEDESWSRFMPCTAQQVEELEDALRTARATIENAGKGWEFDEFFTLEVSEGRELFDAVSVMNQRGYGLVGWAAEFYPAGEESRKRLVEVLNGDSHEEISDGLYKLAWVVD